MIGHIETPPRRGETERHLSLKALAAEWARREGLSIVAQEVSFPHRKFRVDVAACAPARKAPSRKPVPSISTALRAAAVFECKQSRNDLVRDTESRPELVQRIRTLEARRGRLESLLGLDLPHLSKGDSLFPELDCSWLREHNHYGYNKVLDELRGLKKGLREKTKFERMLTYKIANLHYLVAEENLIETHQLPVGWGLLIRRSEGLELVAKPSWQKIGVVEQVIFLQRIASKKGKK